MGTTSRHISRESSSETNFIIVLNKYYIIETIYTWSLHMYYQAKSSISGKQKYLHHQSHHPPKK